MGTYITCNSQFEKSSAFPPILVKRCKKGNVCLNQDDFIKSIKITPYGIKSLCVGVHVFQLLDIFIVDETIKFHMIQESFKVTEKWIGGVLIENTPSDNVKRLLVSGKEMFLGCLISIGPALNTACLLGG